MNNVKRCEDTKGAGGKGVGREDGGKEGWEGWEGRGKGGREKKEGKGKEEGRGTE